MESQPVGETHCTSLSLGAGEALVGEGVANRVTMGSSDLRGKVSRSSLGSTSNDLNDLTGHVLDLA